MVASAGLGLLRVNDTADFALGNLMVRPGQRRVEGAGRSEKLEPRWMDALMLLAREPGAMVSRDALFATCWGGPVGDDSLNRAIAGLRRIGATFGEAGFEIETVRSAGYILRPGAEPDPTQDHAAKVWESWQRDEPRVDREALAAAYAHAWANPDTAEAWGLVALANRMATEVCDPRERTGFLEACQRASARALHLDGTHSVARTALATVGPIFGDWTERRQRLGAVLADDPHCPVALHEMAILERSTGRLDAAVPLLAEVLERFPTAPTILYKRIYHLWTLGDLDALDRFSDRAIQLHPAHMAVVMARFWALAFTGRAERAAFHLEESEGPAAIPPAAMALLRGFLAALGESETDGPLRRAAIAQITQTGRMGPVQANSALIMLAGLGALDEAFALADAYYLGRGPVLVGAHPADGEAEITNQLRRGTQPLFIPSSAAMVADPRFDTLMERIGMAAHWRDAGIVPDYRRARGLS